MAEDRVSRMQRRMLGVLQEELRGWVDDLTKGTFDLSKIMAYARAMGIDMSQLSGMMGQQAGFDPYLILGLDKSASDKEVKKRYRELVRILHPDKSGTPGTATFFQMVNAAYELIKKERGWQ